MNTDSNRQLLIARPRGFCAGVVMAIMSLAVKSFRNRKFTAALTILSIALSVAMLVGIEKLRHQARSGFASTVSGTDLIVGARSSPVHLPIWLYP